ncbi:unnamed protein product [Rhizophagus irregularis]|nr:unnamed protein product [Rhizophagus irregularis]
MYHSENLYCPASRPQNWTAQIDISKFKPDFIEEQIKKEEVEELNPFNYLSNYFSDQAAADKSIIATTVLCL